MKLVAPENRGSIVKGMSAILPHPIDVRNVPTSAEDARGCITATSPGSYLRMIVVMPGPIPVIKYHLLNIVLEVELEVSDVLEPALCSDTPVAGNNSCVIFFICDQVMERIFLLDRKSL